jgi:hypothetical protein
MSVTAKQISEHYLEINRLWRERPTDEKITSYTDHPDWEVAQAARHFIVLMAAWEADNPLPVGKKWRIAVPSGVPVVSL